MAALNNDSLAVIRYLSENRIQEAKKHAIIACINDTFYL